ncbi:putative pyruvate phosphate dikinase regulatory protein, partial [Bienertia sinuspersici]
MMGIKQRLGFKNGLYVDARGRAGGLALLWGEEVNVKLRKMGDRCIDTIITKESNFIWRLTGVYGWLEGSQKHKTWRMLQELNNQPDLPWMICGDFNEILFENEKKVGNAGDFGEGYDSNCSNPLKLFRFEAKWLQADGFDKLVGDYWKEVKKSSELFGGAKKQQLGRDREDILSEVFLPIDAERIRRIPLSPRFPEDIRCWVASKDGVSRVRDAYRIAIMRDQPLSSTGVDPIRKRIWSLRIPPKELMHVMRDCHWVRKLWENGKARWCRDNASSFREWFAGNINECSKKLVRRKHLSSSKSIKMQLIPKGRRKTGMQQMRDEHGAVILAKAKTILQDWTAELAEAKAALEAISLAKDEEMGRVIIEGDAQ